MKAARNDAGLTQQQVATRVKLTRTSITNIERGTQHIALHQLFLLADAVGVSVDALLPDPRAAIEELVPERHLRKIRERGDDEVLDFAARVLSKQRSSTRASKAAPG